MKEQNSKRTQIIGLRLNLEEYELLSKKWKKTNCPRLSDYVRKKLFDKAMVTSYRNQSLDDFMVEMIQLRKALEGSTHSFNQNAKKLYQLDKKADVATWIKIHDLEKRTLQIKVEEIKQKINKIADHWLQ